MLRVFATLAVPLLALAACGGQDQLSQAGEELTFHQRPQIVIDAPQAGAFIQATKDGTVEVRGRTTRSAVTVGGQTFKADGSGAFRGVVKASPGLNLLDVRASGLLGGEAQRAFLYGDFHAAGAPLPAAVEIRSTARAYDDGEPALDDYSSIGRALINQTDAAKLIAPMRYDFGVGSVDIAVASVRFAKERTALSLSPKAVGAHGRGSFAQLVLGLDLTLHLLGSHAFAATVAVDGVGWEGDLNARFSQTATLPDPANPGHTIVGPGIEASMARPAIALGNLTVSTDIDFPGVDAFVTWLTNTFRTAVANAVADQVAQNAGNHFAAELNQFGLPSTFSLKPYGVDASVQTRQQFDAATAFDDQGSTVSAAVAVSWPGLGAAAPGQGTPGSLVVGAAPQATFPAAPLSVSVSFDLINQAAYAVWGQGALQRAVVPAKSYRLFKLDAVVATPRLPPVILPSADGRLRLSLGEVEVTTALHTFFFDGPVSATVGAVADVAVDVNPATGALRFTLAGKPQISVDVNDLLGVVPDALLAPLSDALAAIAPTVVAEVIKPVEVPLPRLPLGLLLAGNPQTLGLSAPAAVAVDAAARRVIVSGELDAK